MIDSIVLAQTSLPLNDLRKALTAFGPLGEHARLQVNSAVHHLQQEIDLLRADLESARRTIDNALNDLDQGSVEVARGLQSSGPRISIRATLIKAGITQLEGALAFAAALLSAEKLSTHTDLRKALETFYIAHEEVKDSEHDDAHRLADTVAAFLAR
ncbi:hypothetical protein ABZ470_39730 [Streptosporangium sp. NPDC020072]|uniref:hypothetical protein n=1 Tax=Streptosporangium sp. NPDC020072 TaxID=3154788 RepID=UPI003436124F